VASLSPRMLEEVDALAQRGIHVGGNLKISDRAHLVMPYHKKQDALSESALGSGKIGTTARGIGPFSGKAFRIAHMGYTNAPMVIGALGAVEMGLAALGIPHGAGGVQRAVEYLGREVHA
jgi:aspartate aminotransferase-like enzyme